MRITKLQRDITLNQGTSRLHSELQNFREKTKGAYDNNRGYSANYDGSFTGKSEAAVNVAKKSGIFTKKWFNKFLTYTNDHNVATSALVALGLAGVMRPATILALPGKKDKEDKIYASGHSMASAILGFVASVIVTSPLDGAVKKIFGSNGYLKDKDGNNIFVAECKFWNGSKALHDAINQLFDRYITWRDIQTALIVFVKNDSFTKILSEIQTAVKTHPYFEQECGISEDTSFSFKFHHSTDIERLINLEVMVFHFPQ